ncbi:aminotransferase-like domain-containing protein [Streptomyces poonensis]|uniref:Aminotransferase n=1 Tax=Streptomyces poonensis TaxID=68255 RepID=A0A918UXE1_9ACTN|nr:PLP-dependent aminotransferase family protein [Streptomyces poonensis]GGZ39853.1 aminotransferase [Streptomyces poonensis]GLJ92896.1 aminotransferase [Streptomyces poonensis]
MNSAGAAGSLRARLAARTRGLGPSPIGEAFRTAGDPGVIPLAAGSPAPEALPTAAVTRIAAELARTHPHALQYGDTSGLPELRELLAARHRHGTGRPTATGQVVITHGAQQGLDLICQALVDPGDTVVVDRPAYTGALQVLRLYRADVAAVPIAGDPGLERLTVLVRRRPVKAVHLVPDFANPSGRTLTSGQRAALAALAERYGFLIIEDNPYGELYFTPPAPRPPLSALSGRVITLGSFSKVLFPAARLGHLTAPSELATVFHTLKQAADLGNSALLQHLVLALLREPGLLRGQTARARAVYRERRDLLMDALRVFDGALRWEPPGGGFFLWARLPEHLDARALLAEALTEKVSFVPGTAFYPSAPDHSALRLSYSYAPLDSLREAAGRLHRAYLRLAGRTPC